MGLTLDFYNISTEQAFLNMKYFLRFNQLVKWEFNNKAFFHSQFYHTIDSLILRVNSHYNSNNPLFKSLILQKLLYQVLDFHPKMRMFKRVWKLSTLYRKILRKKAIIRKESDYYFGLGASFEKYYGEIWDVIGMDGHLQTFFIPQNEFTLKEIEKKIRINASNLLLKVIFEELKVIFTQLTQKSQLVLIELSY